MLQVQHQTLKGLERLESFSYININPNSVVAESCMPLAANACNTQPVTHSSALVRVCVTAVPVQAGASCHKLVLPTPAACCPAYAVSMYDVLTRLLMACLLPSVSQSLH